jgi:hypothetical protein
MLGIELLLSLKTTEKHTSGESQEAGKFSPNLEFYLVQVEQQLLSII